MDGWAVDRRRRNKDKYKRYKKVAIFVNLTLSANHPAHPCTPDKGSAHAHTKNYARMNRESPENAHARAQQRTHLYNYFLACMNNDSEPQRSS